MTALRTPACALVFVLAIGSALPIPSFAQNLERMPLPVDVVDNTLGAVVDLMHERLGWMKEVAGWKWQQELPIGDFEREGMLLNRLRERAEDLGLEPESVVAAFRIQFAMSRAIQEYWYERWELSGFPADWQPRELMKQVRPRLSELTDNILMAMYLRVPNLRNPVGGRLPDLHPLSEYPLEPGLVLELEQALHGISVRPLHQVGLLKRVRSSGLLRVGTTGDYPPFTEVKDEKWDGMDVHLAHLFARSLGGGLVIVQTTWPTLLSDLRAGRFDMAMGGISVTSERARYGYYSNSYHRGGKQLLGRCEDRERLGALKKVNRPGVRVIVNPGGTNEKFVRKHIKHAKIIVHEDNVSIFSQLEEGEVDVMITDAVEAQWQSRSRPLLCVLSNRFLSKDRKAYLTQRDKDFVREVDGWLERLRRSGELKRVTDSYLYPKE